MKPIAAGVPGLALFLAAGITFADTTAPMLSANWVPREGRFIRFDHLPKIRSSHSVVSDVRSVNGVNQHNYLAYHEGRYWLMWSDGPGIEDRVGQRVKFATSVDAQSWIPDGYITPVMPNSGPESAVYNTRSSSGSRWIARGFWVRNNQLIALAALDAAGAYFGPDLALHGFRWNSDQQSWIPLGVIAEDTISNFPPVRLPSGEWMMNRRAHDYTRSGISFLIGGISAPDSWESVLAFHPVACLAAEEPLWWVLPDAGVAALFRDNGRSGFLFRAFSRDNGRHWDTPVRTNFPDASSKAHGIRLADGRYVLVSNPDPERRDPLVISISDDGLVFHSMAYLVGGRWVDYPYVMEAGGSIVVAFSGAKQTVEVLKFPVSELSAFRNKHPGSDVITYYDFSPVNLINTAVSLPGVSSSQVLLTSMAHKSEFFGKSTRFNDVYFRSDAVGADRDSAGVLEFAVESHTGPLNIASVEFDCAFTGGGAFAANRGNFLLQIDKGLGWQDTVRPLCLNVQSEGIAHSGFNGSTRFSIDGLDTGEAGAVRFRVLVFDELDVSNEWMRLDNIKVYAKSTAVDRTSVLEIVHDPGSKVRVIVDGLDVRWCRYQLRRSLSPGSAPSEVVDGPRRASSYKDTFIDKHPPKDRCYYSVERIIGDD